MLLLLGSASDLWLPENLGVCTGGKVRESLWLWIRNRKSWDCDHVATGVRGTRVGHSKCSVSREGRASAVELRLGPYLPCDHLSCDHLPGHHMTTACCCKAFSNPYSLRTDFKTLSLPSKAHPVSSAKSIFPWADGSLRPSVVACVHSRILKRLVSFFFLILLT